MPNDHNKPMTYRTLRERLATLSDKQLDQPVLCSSEEHSSKVMGVWVLKEDYVSMGDGLEPASSYNDEELLEAEARVPVGTVYLDSVPL